MAGHNEVMVPVIGLGVLVVLKEGWLLTLWQKIYAVAHQGDPLAMTPPGTTTPGNIGPNASGTTGVPGTSENPVVSGLLGGITETGGGDMVTGGLPGFPPLQIYGTWSGQQGAPSWTFTPGNSTFPAFQVPTGKDGIPDANSIPTPILLAYYDLLGLITKTPRPQGGPAPGGSR